MQISWDILMDSENIYLGIEAHRNSEENNTSKKNNTNDAYNIKESLKILLDSENIYLGINLSKKKCKCILDKIPSSTEKRIPKSDNETDILK